MDAKASLLSLTLCLPEAALGSLGRKAVDTSEEVAMKTAQISQLQKSLSDERQLSLRKDEELARMQQLVDKLEAAVIHQSKILCLEQSRVASIEDTMKQRLENQLMQEKLLEREATNAKMDRLLEAMSMEKSSRSLAEEAAGAAKARAEAAEAKLEEIMERLKLEAASQAQKRSLFREMTAPADMVSDTAPPEMLDQLQKQNDLHLSMIIDKDRQLGMLQKQMTQEMAKAKMIQVEKPRSVEDPMVSKRLCSSSSPYRQCGASSSPVNALENGSWQPIAKESNGETLTRLIRPSSANLLQSRKVTNMVHLQPGSSITLPCHRPEVMMSPGTAFRVVPAQPGTVPRKSQVMESQALRPTTSLTTWIHTSGAAAVPRFDSL
mmetsp:Transcript_71471/g.152740  ORF Transcript_71471/g.152740 Transcript_71471/m.152740 type:complete len:379 (-) Transcript_71471:59-1195(-)